MSQRAVFARPPSVEDYARMTQRLRLAAAQSVQDKIARIETQRRRSVRRSRLMDATPEETRAAAEYLRHRYQAIYRDTPADQQARLQAHRGES